MKVPSSNGSGSLIHPTALRCTPEPMVGMMNPLEENTSPSRAGRSQISARSISLQLRRLILIFII